MSENPLIATALASARRQLLDLSTRNRMLDAKLDNARAKRIDIVDERSTEVFDLLLQQKAAMTFDPVETRQPSLSTESGSADSSSAAAQSRWTDRKLQTTLSQEKLDSRLLDISFDAQTYEQEQGVNILFLALGFLKWYEAESASTPRYAPLLLIPVALERASAASKFKLRARDEDLLGNLSLEVKLKQDVGIDLPRLPDGEELNLNDYFASIMDAVATQKRWEVEANRMSLAFFSFAKFLMFRDLEPGSWPAEKTIEIHPLVSGMFGGAGTDFGPPLCRSDSDFIDPLIDPENVLHVTDADSSQAVVIEEAKRGRSMVVQGPPGTGKSQTITNILSAAVASGKTVLFVAEKLAALEVVKKRLDNAHLGSMCLELHSHKANKKAVLEELGRTLSEGRPRTPQSKHLIDELRSVRDRLNEHARMMNEPLAPSELSPFQILGELSKYAAQERRWAPWKLDRPELWDLRSAKERETAIAEMVSAVLKIGELESHPWRGVGRDDTLVPSDAFRIIHLGEEVEEAIGKVSEAVKQFAGCIKASSLQTTCSRDALTWHQFGMRLGDLPQMDRQFLDVPQWKNRTDRDAVARLVGLGETYCQERDQLRGAVIEDSSHIDWRKLRRTLAAWGGSWFRWLFSEYRMAIAELDEATGGKLPKTYADRIGLIDRVLQLGRIREEFDGLEARFGPTAFGEMWRGMDSEWGQLRRIADWQNKARDAQLNDAFWKVAARWSPSPQSSAVVSQLGHTIESLHNKYAELAKELRLEPTSFGVPDWTKLPFSAFSERLQIWRASPQQLIEWVAWRRKSNQVKQFGLNDIVTAIEKRSIASDVAVQLFRQSYCESLWRFAMTKRPQLQDVDSDRMEGLVRRFRELDTWRIGAAKAQVAAAHYDGIPRDAERGEMARVRGELSKKRRHMPIRKLLEEAGRVIQRIKPVFMMSPMSIAQFLAPGAVEFDLVVIDEASQVAPEEALGALARAKQAIVVGDSKQMPPSRFFGQSYEEDEQNQEDEAANFSDIESVLGLCLKAGFPERMLKWHYRSQHHSLIAVSNKEFYDSKLFVVPSPGKPADDFGLSFQHVANGVFDRGGSATNRIEARAVAAAVMDHARRPMDRSLGVGAFSVAQRDAIRDEIELLRREEPSLEGFFSSDAEEPFFVKNLENIQGDERDVIFISVGYGRDESGTPRMNFGPLSNEGGERRLNVLISRARKRCVVFSSIKAEDIDLSRAKSRGASAFKQFLHYAEHGGFDDRTRTGHDFDSDFEKQVYDCLKSAGFESEPQVGTAGFRIDLAVIDPSRPGRYILGVECDGATYHSARWARDRDRLRESILRSRGWNIHRIWSTDWFQHRDREVERLLRSVREAIASLSAPVDDEAPTLETSCTVAFERDVVTSEAPSTKRSTPYVEAMFSVEASDLVSAKPFALAQDLERVVRLESPIHKDEAFRRLANLYGHQRIGSKISRRIDEALDVIVSRGAVLIDGEFLSHRDIAVPSVRDRSDVRSANLRKHQFLPLSELAVAVTQVVAENTGIGGGEIHAGVAERMGIGTVTAGFRERVDGVINELVLRGKLNIREMRIYAT